MKYLHQPLRDHRTGDFDETRDIRTGDVIAFYAELSRRIVCVIVNVRHDLFELCIDFFL